MNSRKNSAAKNGISRTLYVFGGRRWKRLLFIGLLMTSCSVPPDPKFNDVTFWRLWKRCLKKKQNRPFTSQISLPWKSTTRYNLLWQPWKEDLRVNGIQLPGLVLRWERSCHYEAFWSAKRASCNRQRDIFFWRKGPGCRSVMVIRHWFVSIFL